MGSRTVHPVRRGHQSHEQQTDPDRQFARAAEYVPQHVRPPRHSILCRGDRQVLTRDQRRGTDPLRSSPGSRGAMTGAAFTVADLATARSEEHTSELQSLMRISYAVFCLKKKTIKN